MRCCYKNRVFFIPGNAGKKRRAVSCFHIPAGALHANVHGTYNPGGLMYRPRNLSLCFLLACGLLLGACGSSKPQDPAPLPAEKRATEKCPGIYLFASSRYLINLVANEEIVIDPARRSIPVYCTPAQARQALKEARDSGKAPASMELRVYQLEGEWRDMVRKDGDSYFLHRAAILLEAVD